MILVQLIVKSVLLVVLVLLMPNLYANDDEIVVIIPTRQFPDWERLRFTSLLPAPWGNQRVEIREKYNKISLLTLRNKKYFFKFPVKRLKNIDNPHLRSAFLVYATGDIENEMTFTVRLSYGQIDEKLKCQPDYELTNKYLNVYFEIENISRKPKVNMTFTTIDECGLSTMYN